MICVDCGIATFNNKELCENCEAGTLSLGMARQCDMSVSCATCRRMVTADSRTCSHCRKIYHLHCDNSEPSTLEGFICSGCRRRLTDDVMLSSSVAPRGSNAPLSPFSDPSVSQISLHMPSVPGVSGWPSHPDFGVDTFSQMSSSATSSAQQHQIQMQQMMAQQSQIMDEISDGGATNDSDRNSSPFFQESSDYDEDFVPVSTRGRGRGGAKKKPGRGQSAPRRQTNPPPSGYFSATQMQAAMGLNPNGIPPVPSTRGKRGKRGTGTGPARPAGKGPGRGRGRGRGSAAQAAAVLQQVQLAAGAASMGLPMMYQQSSSASQMLQMNVSSNGLPPTAPVSLAPPPGVIPDGSPALPNAPSAAQSTIPDMPPATSSVPDFQQAPQPVAIREVDESMMEDESSRQSGESRSDGQEYVRTAIVCRVNDEFLQKACMCLACGSVGKGAESSMVACSNCAQTYHTYCVGLHEKLNSAVMSRGWRCLDCTVCEGCGNGGDEANLLLCDECDISYHIYHIKPPLDKIPVGPWRCSWCSRCRRCNHKVTSASELTSHGLCHPCSSLQMCPRCNKGYQLCDKIIRCSQCSKWQHGHCEGLYTDEQLEQAATNRMRCSACRPNRIPNSGYFDSETIVVCDYVAMKKTSDELFKSGYNPSALKQHVMETYGKMESFDHYDDDTNTEEASEHQVQQPTTSQRGRGRGNPGGRRGTNRLGVGGFITKLPRHRLQALEEAAAAEDDETKRLKRPRKPRKSQLEDAYPPGIQEAFFGIKAVDGKGLVDIAVDEPMLAEYTRYGTKLPVVLKASELSLDAAEMLRNDIDENALLENVDLGNFDVDMDGIDFSFFDTDDYDDELEDSLQGDMDSKEGITGEKKLGPTTFNLDQPSTSGAQSSLGGPPGMQFHSQMHNIAQQAPGIRAANTISRSGSQSTDAPERYQFAERWEEDEPLGLQATTAAVLYANEKHAYLKEQHKDWSDRVKQIQKLWRNLSSDDRQEYVNRARENRTNRGRMPRPRRANVHSTNSVDSPTIQSPAPHQMGFKVPAIPGDPNSLGAGPGPSDDPSIPAPPKQVRITCHLPPDVHQQYHELKRVQMDRENLTSQNEEGLNKARKQKKNLSAKKRQLIKTASAAPDYDGRELDLSDSDKQQMATLTERIKSMQTEVENSKREQRMHEGIVRDFEQRHGILKYESEVTQDMIHRSEMRDQQYAQAMQANAQQIAAQAALGQPAPPQGLPLPPPQGIQLPPPQQRVAPFQMPMLRGGPPQPGGLPGPQPVVVQSGIPGPAGPQSQTPPQGITIIQQGAPGVVQQRIGPPGAPAQFVLIRTANGQLLTPQQQQEIQHRHMMMIQQQQHQARMRRLRSMEMGGMRYEQITDPVMKDVYEFLDEVIHDITFHIEHPNILQQQGIPILQHPQGPPGQQGPQGPPGSQHLKRTLAGPPPGLHLMMPGHLPPGHAPPGQQPGGPLPLQAQLQQSAPGSAQPPPTPMSAQPPQVPGMDDGPKPKKKRNVQKKATTSFPAGGEYDSWIEKMKTRFRLCPEVPKRQREPSLDRPGCDFTTHALTEMTVGPGKQPLIGQFGEMNVKRGVRIFGNEERTRKVLLFPEISLYQVEPQIRLFHLYNNRGPPTEAEQEIFQDEEDRTASNYNPNAVILRLLNKKRPRLEHIRSQQRYNDEARAPLAPDYSMFYEEKKPEEDVTVELVFNTEHLTPESSVDEKKELIVKFNDQIKEMLRIKKELPWKMEDTPPDSPAPSSPEPDASEIIRSSTSRAPSTSVEKEIKREVEDETAAAAPMFKDIKKEIIESSCTQYKCKHCQKDVEGSAPAVRLKADKLGILSPEASSEEKEELVSFCSRKCYYDLMSTSKVALNHDELTAAEQHVDEETFNRLKQIHSDSIVRAVNQGKSKLPCAPAVSSVPGDSLTSPRDARYMMEEGKKENTAVVTVSSLIGAVEAPKDVPVQRTAEDWKPYGQNITDSFRSLNQQHWTYIHTPKIGVPHPPYELDKRLCVFCGGVGDGETSTCGRLISLTEFYWVHVNCALWSPEVFEGNNGALTNVERAVIRAAQAACELCKRPGASVKCHMPNCGVSYHVICGLQTTGLFRKDRTFICKAHDVPRPVAYINRLDAMRKIYVKRDENAMLMRLFDLVDGNRLCLRLGAFTFYKLGSILPKQLKRFHNKDHIFPNQYRATRLFWSPKNHRERMMYECTIEDKNNTPIFVVRSLDDPSICIRATSATKAWLPIYERVTQLREHQQGESLRFFGSHVPGETLFGLNENAITKITESLPGFDTVFTYQHRHQNSPVLELPLAENPMGCARAEARTKNSGQHFRTRPQPMGGTSHHQHGMMGSSSGQSSQPAVVSSSGSQDQFQTRQAATSLTSANSGRTRGIRSYYTEEAAARARAFGISPDLASLAMRMEPMQSTQSTFSAYQKMRREWKERVYLARSRIAGLGLYAKHDISMGEYIIEYKGEVIRSEVCEVREVRYVTQNRGVYMFRIDEEWVIDATMAGGPARYINHSCDPNCSTQIMDAGSGPREKKIIIMANRPISTGEELTYDYQFELEDSTDKIPCLCGAPNCVKWMN